MSFTHLHVHSEYSLLDGACRIEPMLDKIKSMGQTSVAITDHGVMYIGHIIEEISLSCGAGHFFRAMKWQDMSGIDIVLHQLLVLVYIFLLRLSFLPQHLMLVPLAFYFLCYIYHIFFGLFSHRSILLYYI